MRVHQGQPRAARSAACSKVRACTRARTCHRVHLRAVRSAPRWFLLVVEPHPDIIRAAKAPNPRDEGDLGPNTGGMGAYSPAPVIDQPLNDRILRTVVLPTLNGMNDERRSYSGFLYVGLMIDEKGDPKVLEYNCRFGDPETQPIMMRLKTDLVSAVLQTMSGEGGSLSLEFDDKVALGVVLATQGYPGLYEEGLVVEGLSEEETDTKVFIYLLDDELS